MSVLSRVMYKCSLCCTILSLFSCYSLHPSTSFILIKERRQHSTFFSFHFRQQTSPQNDAAMFLMFCFYFCLLFWKIHFISVNFLFQPHHCCNLIVMFSEMDTENRKETKKAYKQSWRRQYYCALVQPPKAIHCAPHICENKMKYKKHHTIRIQR